MADKKKKETKNERFKRVASHRTNEVLVRLRLLQNCSNRQIYDYDEGDVKKIFKTLETRIRELRASFSDKPDSTNFQL